MSRKILVSTFIVMALLLLAFYRVNTKDSDEAVKKKIRCVIVTEHLPVPDITGMLRNHDTLSMPIYYYGDLVAYRQLCTMIKKWDGNGNVESKEDYYQYFVFEKGKSSGYIYNSYYPGKKDLVAVDSMMKNVLWCELNSSNFYKTFADNNTRLIRSEKSADGSMLQEWYEYKRKNDSTQHGTFSLHFTNKLQSIPFSMSPELDKMKGMKLIATGSEGYFRYVKGKKIIKDTANSSDHMREIRLSPVDSADIMHYFDRYVADKRN